MKNKFSRTRLFVKSMKGKILDKTLTLRLVFLIIPFKCSLKLRLLPALTHYSLVLFFYTPWKHQKTKKFSDVFGEYRKAAPGCNGLTPSSFSKILFSIFIFLIFWFIQLCFIGDKIAFITILIYYYTYKYIIIIAFIWLSRNHLNKFMKSSSSDLITSNVISRNIGCIITCIPWKVSFAHYPKQVTVTQENMKYQDHK